MMQPPSVSRIVHYYERPYDEAKGELRPPLGPQAAIITRVWSDTCVNLHVFFDNAPSGNVTSVLFDESETPSASQTWRWPPRI
jgi:hypothetical protein